MKRKYLLLLFLIFINTLTGCVVWTHPSLSTTDKHAILYDKMNCVISTIDGVKRGAGNFSKYLLPLGWHTLSVFYNGFGRRANNNLSITFDAQAGHEYDLQCIVDDTTKKPTWRPIIQDREAK